MDQAHDPDSSGMGQVPMDRLRTVFDGMFDGVWLVDGSGRTTYANTAMAELLSTTPPEMAGRPIAEFLPEGSRADIEGFLLRMQSGTGERIELPFRRPDGTHIVGLLAGSPIATAQGEFAGTVLNFSDLTRRRALEAQLAQNQKMQAMGEFAGVIAHDFNNLLTAIRGHTELARAGLPDPEASRKDLDQIIASADRASAITRKLLAFTRQQVLLPLTLDPGQVITDLVPLLQPLLGDAIDVVLHIQPDHPWILVDPVQLEQVIVNLAVNARDAMPAGGTLTITVEALKAERTERPDDDAAGRADVRIMITDTGTGMNEETKARIFDPFFTTKLQGRGTGLGLATVYGVVTQSGGHISVESAPNRGSSFRIELPGVNRPAERDQAGVIGESRGAGAGVVLLVEDEPTVREVARRFLEGAGFNVISTAGGKEAVRASERWSEPIDVLLTDVLMPGLQGPEVAEAIRAQRPDIGVVFMSGFAQDALGPGSELASYGAFLPKPFSADVLVRAVKGAVRRSPPSGARSKAATERSAEA